jgi:hypothetical protein
MKFIRYYLKSSKLRDWSWVDFGKEINDDRTCDRAKDLPYSD